MGDIDAGREGAHVRVTLPLGLVQAVAAGEDQIGRGEQLGFQRQQFGRREAEGGQFVHAVIDGACRADMARKAEHHRRVVPADRHGTFQRQKVVEQAAQCGVRILAGQAVGQMRRDDMERPGGAQGETRRVVAADDRLFPHHHPVGGGKPRHQMLRTLEHEIPAQVAEAQQQRRDAAGRKAIHGHVVSDRRNAQICISRAPARTGRSASRGGRR